jgi:hypothetical protein
MGSFCFSFSVAFVNEPRVGGCCCILTTAELELESVSSRDEENFDAAAGTTAFGFGGAGPFPSSPISW